MGWKLHFGTLHMSSQLFIGHLSNFTYVLRGLSEDKQPWKNLYTLSQVIEGTWANRASVEYTRLVKLLQDANHAWCTFAVCKLRLLTHFQGFHGKLLNKSTCIGLCRMQTALVKTVQAFPSLHGNQTAFEGHTRLSKLLWDAKLRHTFSANCDVLSLHNSHTFSG